MKPSRNPQIAPMIAPLRLGAQPIYNEPIVKTKLCPNLSNKIGRIPNKNIDIAPIIPKDNARAFGFNLFFGIIFLAFISPLKLWRF